MNNNRRQAQFLLRSITDDVPQLLLEENNLVFRNELKEDILIPCSSIISIKILPINRIYNPSVGLLKDGMKGFMAHRNAGVFSIYNKKYKYFFGLIIAISIFVIIMQVALYPEYIIVSKILTLVLGLIFFIFPFGNTIDSIGIKNTVYIVRTISTILIILGIVSIVFDFK